MKRIFFAVLGILFLNLFVFHSYSDEIPPPVRQMMRQIEQAIDQGNKAAILSLVSLNARPGLAQEIQKVLSERSMNYQMDLTGVKDLGDGKIKVSNRFRAKGVGWELNGLSNEFILQTDPRSPYGYSIVDTDFHKKVGTEYTLKFVGKIFLILIPIFLVCFAFWLWMLIDLLRRPLPDKTVWMVVVILLGVLGALVYFFGPRRKALKGAL